MPAPTVAGPQARWRAVVGVVARVVGPAVVLAGWFFVRNWILYGSPTADDRLLARARRRPNGSLVEVLVNGEFVGRMGRGLYGSIHPKLFLPHAGLVPLVLLATTGAGLALLAARRRSSRRSPPAAAVRPGVGRSDGAAVPLDLAVGALLGAYVLAVVVGTASFFSEGGSAHPRYFLPIVPVLAAVAARAITALPGGRVVAVTAVAGLVGVVWSQARRYPDLISDRYHLHPFDQASVGPAGQAVALAVAALAALAVGAVLLGGVPPRSGPEGDR